MNGENYKQRTSKPTSFRRSELEQIVKTIVSSSPADSQVPGYILQSEPIHKPDLHDAGSESDWFEVSMPDDVIRRIADALLDAEAEAVLPEDAPSSEEGRIADLLDRWSRKIQPKE